MKRKWLAVGIILLFVGGTIAPTINFNIVEASQDNNLIEITTQACGIQGYKDTTVKLTRDQYQNLQQYLVEFRAKLNETSTSEEAMPIFKETVVELKKYGLLPKGMSENQASRLMMRPFEQRMQLFDENYFCLVSGNTNNTFSYGPLATAFSNIVIIVLYSIWMSNNGVSPYLSGILSRDFIDWLIDLLFLIKEVVIGIGAGFFFLWIWSGGLFSFFEHVPFGLLTLLTFGYNEMNGDQYPSSGWVYSIGLTGIKKYEGPELWGTARQYPYFNLPFAIPYPGVLGFSGLKMRSSSGYTFFLGSAVKVKLGTEFPG